MGFVSMLSNKDLQNKKIYIFGAGLEGVQAEYCFKDHVVIESFVDNYVEGKTGSKAFDILKPEEVVKAKNAFFIVATSERSYEQVKAQLNNLGLKEFQDYIYWKLLGKRIVYLHGNCHMLVVKEMLNTSKEFVDNYGIYPLKCVQDIKEIEKNVIKNTDIIISQDIREDNSYGKKLSLDYLKELSSNNTKIIVIPNLFGMGKAFFPQDISGSYHPIGDDINGMFPHEDKVINECIKNRWSIEEIINEVLDGRLISKEDIEENFNLVFQKYKQRMQKCDIDEYDFIMENYKNKQLFYDVGHPTNYLIKDIVIKVLRMLGIKDDCDENVVCLDGHEVIMYPCVSKVLGLCWTKDKIRLSNSGKRLCFEMDIAEYIREYIWWRSNDLS